MSAARSVASAAPVFCRFAKKYKRSGPGKIYLSRSFASPLKWASVVLSAPPCPRSTERLTSFRWHHDESPDKSPILDRPLAPLTTHRSIGTLPPSEKGRLEVPVTSEAGARDGRASTGEAGDTRGKMSQSCWHRGPGRGGAEGPVAPLQRRYRRLLGVSQGPRADAQSPFTDGEPRLSKGRLTRPCALFNRATPKSFS